MTDSNGANGPLTSRRLLLSLAGGGVVAGAVSPAKAADKPGAAATRVPTSEVGRKFRADGRVRTFRGNTIVCHLPQQGDGSACFNALLDIYRDLPVAAFASHMTALPPSSYHMTVFDGSNETARIAGVWPPGLSLDSPIEACNQAFVRRLEGFRLDYPLPIRMRVDLENLEFAGNALAIPLTPIDEDENRRLRGLRDQLSAVTGIRSPRHDQYRFHITLAYILWELSPLQVEAVRRSMRDWGHAVAAASPVIELPMPEICTFKDMFAFNRVRYLA